MNGRPGRLSHGEQAAAQRRGHGFSAGSYAKPHEERLQGDVDLMFTGAKLMGNFVEGDTGGKTLQHRPLGRRNLQYHHRFLPED